MPQGWKKYKFVQIRKKTLAGLHLIFLFVWFFLPNISFGQNRFDHQEFNEYNGIPSLVTRQTYIDQDGSAWIGTDAGLAVFPKKQKAKESICKQLKQFQIWGIAQVDSFLYIGTYDSGAYCFDINRGKLLNKIPHNRANRIRKIKQINGKVYLLHSEGIGLFQGSSYTNFVNELPQSSGVKPSFPIDIFNWNDSLYVSFYRNNELFRLADDGKLIMDSLYIKSMPAQAKKKAFQLLCGISFQNKLILGSTQNRIGVYDSTNFKIIHLKSAFNRNLTVWDITTDGKFVYLAIGNNKNLAEGATITLSPEDLKRPVIEVAEAQFDHFTWSVFYDDKNDGIWSSTLTNGVFYRPQLCKWQKIPENFEDFQVSKNFIVAWNGVSLQIKDRKTRSWTRIENKIKPIQISEWKGRLFAIGIDGLYEFSSDKSHFKLKVEGDFSQMLQTKYGIFLRTLFGPMGLWNPDNHTFLKNVHKGDIPVIDMIYYMGNVIYQVENTGYFLYQNQSIHPLKTDFHYDFHKSKFYFLGRKLILQFGTELRVCDVDFEQYEINTINTFNLNDFFSPGHIKWTKANKHGLWMGNTENIYQFTLDQEDHSPRMVKEFYIGNSSRKNTKVLITGNQAFKKSQQSLQVFNLKRHKSLLEIDDFDVIINGSSALFNHKIERAWENEILDLEISSPHYFLKMHGRLPLFVSSDSQWISRKFIPVLESQRLSYPSGVYQVEFGSQTRSYKHFFRINSSLLSMPSFWILFVLALMLFVAALFQNQQDKILLTQRVSDLQLNTLRTNLNPHFVFNIMNLIQSLIVRSEKKKALEATSELASINRLFLETYNKELITLDEELTYLEKYMKLEHFRFEDKNSFDYESVIEENVDLRKWQLPPLILQPLLENAIKHGNKTNNNIKLRVELEAPHIVLISISNLLIENGSKHRPLGTNMGVSLVKERINLMNSRYSDILKAEFNQLEEVDNEYVVEMRIERVNYR